MTSSSSSSSLNAFDLIVSCDKTLLKLKPSATYTYDETNHSVCQCISYYLFFSFEMLYNYFY